jgi:hypothetical protein
MLAFLCVCVFVKGVLLCIPGWLQSFDLPASASSVLGLQVCATTLRKP